MAPTIICVAIIGKNNNPLYIKSFGGRSDPLKFHYVVHTSLDIVEEKARKGSSQAGDMFLGLLCPIEEYKVYGYITNTRVKIIAVVEVASIREIDIKTFLTQTHHLYVNTITNPFYELGSPITSDTFEQHLAKTVATHERLIAAHK